MCCMGDSRGSGKVTKRQPSKSMADWLPQSPLSESLDERQRSPRASPTSQLTHLQLLSPFTHTPTECGLPGMGTGSFSRSATYSPTTAGTEPSCFNSNSRHSPLSSSRTSRSSDDACTSFSEVGKGIGDRVTHSSLPNVAPGCSGWPLMGGAVLQFATGFGLSPVVLFGADGFSSGSVHSLVRVLWSRAA